MAASWSSNFSPSVRMEATNSSNGTHPPQSPSPSPGNRKRSRRPLLSVSKPSWIVRTESNVRLERKEKPEPPCVICKGSGKADCSDCRGKGRTNRVQLTMLPNGEWPKWCRTCGGSGLWYCSRCLGTGEFRHEMGFQFTKRSAKNDAQNREHVRLRGNLGNLTASDILLWDERPEGE